MKSIILAFIPMFIAVDAIGLLPIFIALTGNINKKQKQRVVFQSVITAICLAVGFILIGKAILKVLNITIGDFMVAGGIVLFCIAILDIVNPLKRRRVPIGELGVVPLGTPLIVGPAVLTTSLIIVEEYGLLPTLISILGNVILAGLCLYFSTIVIRIIGTVGARVASKIAALLLSAIAVMMIRKGIFLILGIS